MRLKKIFFGLTLLLIPCNFILASANYSIHPTGSEESWFIYNKVQPGAIFNDAITIVNPFSHRVSFIIYALDAEIKPDGGFAPAPKENKQRAIGSWLKLKENQIIVKANSSYSVPFKLKIPDSIAPKHYLGVILLTTSPLPANEGEDNSYVANSNIGIEVRVGVRVYVNMAGAPALSDRKIISAKTSTENEIKNTQEINKKISASTSTTSISTSTISVATSVVPQTESIIIKYIVQLGQFAIDYKWGMLWIIILIIMFLIWFWLTRER